jgi:predicted dehydrogenase
MARSARKKGCWAGVAYNYPHFPAISKLKDIIDTLQAGTAQVLNITCHAYCYHHMLSILYHLFGAPDTIDAHGTKRKSSDPLTQKSKISNDILYVPGTTFSCRLVFHDNIVCTITASLLPSLHALPFHIIGILDSSNVVEISGLDWGKNMKGRMFYLPDTEAGVELGDIPVTNHQLSFDGYCADTAQRLLSNQGPSFNWEDGWNIMLMEHAMILSDRRHATIDFHDLKTRKETEFAKGSRRKETL